MDTNGKIAAMEAELTTLRNSKKLFKSYLDSVIRTCDMQEPDHQGIIRIPVTVQWLAAAKDVRDELWKGGAPDA